MDFGVRSRLKGGLAQVAPAQDTGKAKTVQIALAPAFAAGQNVFQTCGKGKNRQIPRPRRRRDDKVILLAVPARKFRLGLRGLIGHHAGEPPEPWPPEFVAQWVKEGSCAGAVGLDWTPMNVMITW